MKKTVFWLLPVIALQFSACTQKKEETPAPAVATATPENTNVQKNAFKGADTAEVPFRIFKLLSQNSGNVNYSPLSFNMAMTQAYLGAGDAVQEKIEEIFGFSGKGFSFESEMDLARELKKNKTEGAQIIFANSAWISSPYLAKVKATFKQDISKHLDSSVKKADLKAINQWVEESTQGKIKDLLDQLPNGIAAILVNTLYFKADWETPFKAEATRFDNFKASPHLMVKAEMMNQTHKMPYFEDKIAQYLALTYKNSPLEMIVALPTKADLKELSQKFSAELIASARKGMTEETVELSLPKFKFETKKSLETTFSEAGYGDLFKRGSYTRLIADAKDFRISEIIQATMIAVDEKGTEAAAATAFMGEVASMPMNLGRKRFNADHPFLFLIRNSRTGEIYFMGRVFNPLENR